MKNMFRLFSALLLLVTVNAHAKTQTMIAGTDNNPFTLQAAGKMDMGGYNNKDKHGMGLKNLGGTVGIAHLVGTDFEYGVEVSAGWATTLNGQMFAEKDANKDGFKTGVNLSGRYMPFVFDSIRLGGLLNIGYSRLFGDGNKSMRDAFSFGDTSFDVGPSFMHKAHPMFSWGLGLTYGMSEMRFGGSKANEMQKKFSNLHTVRLPIDAVIHATESIGVTLALEPAWRHLPGHKFYQGLFYDVVAGVNIGF